MTDQTQIPALQGQTPIARDAPTPDSLESVRPRTRDKGTIFCFVCSEGTKSQKRLQHLCLRLEDWTHISVVQMLQRKNKGHPISRIKKTGIFQ